MTPSDASEDELLERIAALEEENKRLRAKLRWYEGPHTPPSKQQSSGDESSSSVVIQKRFASRVLYECNEPKAAKGDQTSSDGR